MMNTPLGSNENQRQADIPSLKNITTVVYALQALSFFVGVTYFVAIIMNYVKWDDVRGTWLESHFRWQIRTFWFGLLWFALGGLTVLIGIGWIILFVAVLWLIYRIIKGWLNLYDNKPLSDVKIPNGSEWYSIGFGVTAVITFIGTWIYCIYTYGFLLGVGIGWLPSLIVAVFVGALWPLAVLAIAVIMLFLQMQN